jgi:mannose-6-phosphate isomerase-like protein (cupin superfamily)
MHILSKNKVTSPFDSGQGEIVYELLGRTFPGTTENHSVAHVVIASGKSSRLHIHPIAEESYYILQGKARLLIGEEESIVSPGQVVLIPPGKTHQIVNTGLQPLEFLAICVPAWEPGNSVYLT